MEEENKVAKKSSNPKMIIALALILILCGVVLMATGNNKSFLAKDEKEAPAPVEPADPVEPEPDPIDDGQRGIVPQTLSDETALQLIVEEKEANFADATWSVGVVRVIGHDEKDEKFLVEYEHYDEESVISMRQTIISVINGEQSVELPGWVEGERDLTVYNFIMYGKEGTEPTEPTTPVEPTEPADPVEPTDPTVPVEPTEPADPVEPTDPTVPVEPTEPTTPAEPTEPTVQVPEQSVESTVQPGENE